MKIRRFCLLSFCVFVLSVMVSYPVDARPRPTRNYQYVESYGNPRGKCKRQDLFSTSDVIHAQGRYFPGGRDVFIYVTSNEVWEPTKSIDTATIFFTMTATTDNKGKISCKGLVTFLSGDYDIVVDFADGDGNFGTFNPIDGDAVDGETEKPGFVVQ